uniref:SFRICE_001758 n=1 Tax=Spodoptera frugiperda TaxID=7108 RepID=A0A2H1V8H0_SPOFR
MLRHEWAGLTGVLPRPRRNPTEVTGGPIPPFPTTIAQQSLNFLIPKRPVTPLVFRVSLVGDDCLQHQVIRLLVYRLIP